MSGTSSRPRWPRRQRLDQGLGLVMALVLWVAVLAFLFAIIESQATGNAFVAVARASQERTLRVAAQSALEEASFAIRHPPSGRSALEDAFEHGRVRGVAHDPVATRDLFSGAAPDTGSPATASPGSPVTSSSQGQGAGVAGGPAAGDASGTGSELTLGPVEFVFVGGVPDAKTAAGCFVDLSARAHIRTPGVLRQELTRQVRRRYWATFDRIRMRMGPGPGRVVNTVMHIDSDPTLEVIEP